MKSAVLVAGPDAVKFLQGQLTCDLNLLTPDHPLRGAHCNPKGRVEALYDLIWTQGGILLITPHDVIQHALEKLQFYARFSKVALKIVSADEVVDFSAAMPELHPETLGRYLPQELGLDQTDAVSFTKGCYIGQEVVARVHFLGKLKKTVVKITLNLPATPGAMIDHPEWGEVEVIDCRGSDALVLKKI